MKLKTFGYIYLIENDINSKLYVGQTTKSETRIRKHFHNNRKDTAIGCAIRKYGSDHFDLILLEGCYSQQELDEREIFWIKQANTRVPVGYNLTSGGAVNAQHSSETIEKMRRSKQGPNNLMFGKELSVEHRDKISKARKARFALVPHPSIGRKHSEETKKKMRESRYLHLAKLSKVS